MKNGRCRLHGGLTPSKHPNFKGSANALKSGFYAGKAIEERRKYARDIKYLLGLAKKYGLNADRRVDLERWESKRMQELAKSDFKAR
jgi:flavin-dependent dehydrogenase